MLRIDIADPSRDTFAQLTTAPMLKPLDWTRSRVRRDHLISMGVPVNLDEVGYSSRIFLTIGRLTSPLHSPTITNHSYVPSISIRWSRATTAINSYAAST